MRSCFSLPKTASYALYASVGSYYLPLALIVAIYMRFLN